MTADDMVYDKDLNKMRPKHRGRIRSLNSPSPKPVPPDGDGETVEVWEGGRFVGYERTSPDRKRCKLPFLGG